MSSNSRSLASQSTRNSLPPYRSSYSRFVWLLKYVLPIVAMVVIILLVVWPELGQEPDKFRIPKSDIRIQTKGGQRVKNATFTGIDRNNRTFSVSAEGVIQNSEGAKGVILIQPKADVMLANDTWVIIEAPNGTFWRKRDMLELVGGVNLFHDYGYEVKTSKIRIDLKERTAAGDATVHAQGPHGKIKSQGLRVVDNGSRVIFTGKARLELFSSVLRRKTGK
tara:strand:- start:198 stop:863 length:666 start_codon:yes stop_codon:yes gene_type:complete